jgi:hypothetical protein
VPSSDAYSVIIAGSRDIDDPALLRAALDDAALPIGEVVSGAARGVDTLGEQWAKAHGVHVERFPVTSDEWKYIGNSAGRKRNADMLLYTLKSPLKSAILTLWDGQSTGTAHMIGLGIANERNIECHVYIVRTKPDGTVRLGRASDELVRELLAHARRNRGTRLPR